MAPVYSQNDLMKIAVEEHLKCTEFPRVGAVISKSGEVLSTGFRGEVGKIHAERVALEKISEADSVGATVFTTLEPCVDIRENQTVSSCTNLIIERGIAAVVIGVLDPNASIYTQGFRKLLENNVSVSFFNRKLREAVEEQTFEYGAVDKVIGSGKRRVPVVGSGIEIKVQFSNTDARTIAIRWSTIQYRTSCVDLLGGNGSIRSAFGARHFGDITDPAVFRFPSHFARMKKGDIAIVQPSGATFCVLIKLLEVFENDVLFQWEVRNV